MEATGCRLAMTGHGTLVIVSVYLPSPKKLLRRDLRAILALGDTVILFGDFNCKSTRWRCPSNSYNGDKLNRLEDRLDSEIIEPSTSTYFPNIVTNRPSTLDIGLIKGVALNFNCIETLHTVSCLTTDRGVYPYTSSQKPDNSVALDDAEIAECLADSIESQCSHAYPPYDIAHINHIEEEVQHKASLEPKDDLPPVSLSEVQTLVKSLQTKETLGLDGISNKSIKWFSLPLLTLLVAKFNAYLKKMLFPSRLERDGGNKHSQARETSRSPCQLQTNQPPERSGQTFSREFLKLA
ncbi:RNA-directed DNA polymerase from mobile element jockey [Eumeta japonica]|uniref:RNA-directed DNA polymerase from mobile element jockey n=1 Tax=Eumeta variegata TaxID=151549 RepID=A0A4C2AEZ7_EUMVA|nr:RNA-directed DNA polymerase from mobile element jockey [Eumeta japonica]